MADVHAEGDLGLAAITPEMPLTDEQPHQQAGFEVCWHGTAFLVDPAVLGSGGQPPEGGAACGS
jgi:hypothetical protein